MMIVAMPSLARLATCSCLRTVPSTRSPDRATVRASLRPKPVDMPVMNQRRAVFSLIIYASAIHQRPSPNLTTGQPFGCQTPRHVWETIDGAACPKPAKIGRESGRERVVQYG